MAISWCTFFGTKHISLVYPGFDHPLTIYVRVGARYFCSAILKDCAAAGVESQLSAFITDHCIHGAQ